MLREMVANWSWRKAEEFQGTVRYVSYTNNVLVGRYSLLLVDSDEGFDTRPVIFYDTISHGKCDTDLANSDIKEGDLVRFTLNAPLSDREKIAVDCYCPAGFSPVFRINSGFEKKKAA